MSAIPDTKDALSTLLADFVPDVEVTRGVPEQLPTGRRNFYLLGAEDIVQTREGVGLLQEDFNVRFIIECHAPKADSDRATIEAELWAVVADLGRLVDGESRFGQYVTDSEVRLEREQTGFIRDGWLSRCHGVVHVRAIT